MVGIEFHYRIQVTDVMTAVGPLVCPAMRGGYMWKLIKYLPQLLGPLSEIFGRSRVLQLANMWYLGVSHHFFPGSCIMTFKCSMEHRL